MANKNRKHLDSVLALGGKVKTKRHNLNDRVYDDIMIQVGKENYHDWGFSTPQEATEYAKNDKSYDYRSFYEDNPNAIANAKLHWTDYGKGVTHPTFSNESKYHGIADKRFNPAGLRGGSWIGDTFIPATWQMPSIICKQYNKGIFRNGGGIYIKPENRGKFTATMKRTGKTAEELSHSSNPLTRKRAIFALNARKWHH